ncbi:MAG: dihydrodipicolinate synthase family protein [Methanomassiliicoccales archaeon]|jgi:4-hydroxy-tetrahydrodipicolinate synthase|nr:dihydrodipicolinate synthase family protein [Methanomassiliicoccales archaeon]
MDPEKFRERCKGVLTLVPTAFKKNYELDLESLREHVRYLVENRVTAVIPAGSTGEFSSMSEEEIKKVISATVDEVNGKTMVVAGTAHSGTHETIKLTKYAEDVGCDAAMIVTPYYFKEVEEGIFQHYKMIADSVDIAIMPYNNPWVTSGVIYSYRLVERFAKEIPNITALKDVTGNSAYVLELLRRVGKKIAILPYAETEHTMLCYLLGCPGTISLLSNIAPKESIELWKAAYLEKDAKKAMEILDKFEGFNRLMNRLIMEKGIPAYLHLIKHALTLLGRPCGLPMRPPAQPLRENEVEELRQALVRMGLM